MATLGWSTPKKSDVIYCILTGYVDFLTAEEHNLPDFPNLPMKLQKSRSLKRNHAVMMTSEYREISLPQRKSHQCLTLTQTKLCLFL